MGESCLWYEKLNAELLHLARSNTVLKRNKEPNREMLLSNAENSSILTLEYWAFPPSNFSLKEGNFHNYFRSNGCSHKECLTHHSAHFCKVMFRAFHEQSG